MAMTVSVKTLVTKCVGFCGFPSHMCEVSEQRSRHGQSMVQIRLVHPE